MKIVVTGATSMIGAELIRIAVCDSDVETVYAVIRPNCNRLNRLPNNAKIKLIVCDTNQYEALPCLIHDKCNVLYHFAWLSTGKLRNTDLEAQAMNIIITIQAVKAAASLGCRLFVGAGSQAEYGFPGKLPIEPTDYTNPVQAYGIAKLAAGKLARQQAASLGVQYVWVRIFSIYGPDDKMSTMIMSTFEKVKKGVTPEFTKGENRWDYLYSSDAGKAFLAIAKAKFTRDVYCLGSGENRTVREYIRIMEKVIKPKNPFKIGALDYPVQGPLQICADTTALVDDTGWHPETDFETGIRQIKYQLGV